MSDLQKVEVGEVKSVLGFDGDYFAVLNQPTRLDAPMVVSAEARGKQSAEILASPVPLLLHVDRSLSHPVKAHFLAPQTANVCPTSFCRLLVRFTPGLQGEAAVCPILAHLGIHGEDVASCAQNVIIGLYLVVDSARDPLETSQECGLTLTRMF